MPAWMAKIASDPALFAGVIGTAAIWAALIWATPVVVRRLPSDFFSNPAHLRRRGRDGRPFLLYAAIVAARNIAGVALVVLGTVFLQGVIVAMAGLGIMDIPGKDRAVRRLAAIPFVWRLMARIREKAELPPLIHPFANQMPH